MADLWIAIEVVFGFGAIFTGLASGACALEPSNWQAAAICGWACIGCIVLSGLAFLTVQALDRS